MERLKELILRCIDDNQSGMNISQIDVVLRDKFNTPVNYNYVRGYLMCLTEMGILTVKKVGPCSIFSRMVKQ